MSRRTYQMIMRDGDESDLRPLLYDKGEEIRL